METKIAYNGHSARCNKGIHGIALMTLFTYKVLFQLQNKIWVVHNGWNTIEGSKDVSRKERSTETSRQLLAEKQVTSIPRQSSIKVLRYNDAVRSQKG
jgi:hypothetical protein